jgi:tetratricopeptide (TPR) repeat protein
MSEVIVQLDQLPPWNKQRGLVWLFFMWSLCPDTDVPLGLLQSIQYIVERDGKFQYMFPHFGVVCETVVQLGQLGMLLFVGTSEQMIRIENSAQRVITEVFDVKCDASSQYDWDPEVQSELRPEFWIETTTRACSLYLAQHQHVTQCMKKHLSHLLHHTQQYKASSLLELPPLASVELVQYVAASYVKLGMLDAAAGIYEHRLEQFEKEGDDGESVRSAMIFCEGLSKIYVKLHKFDEAIDYLDVLLSLYSKGFSPPDRHVAEMYVEAAVLLHERSDRDDLVKAVLCLRSAVKILKEVLGSPTAEEGTILYNIAVLLEEGGKNVEAEAELGKASAVFRKLNKPNPKLDTLHVLIWLNLSTSTLEAIKEKGLSGEQKSVLENRLQKLSCVVNQLRHE